MKWVSGGKPEGNESADRIRSEYKQTEPAEVKGILLAELRYKEQEVRVRSVSGELTAIDEVDEERKETVSKRTVELRKLMAASCCNKRGVIKEYEYLELDSLGENGEHENREKANAAWQNTFIVVTTQQVKSERRNRTGINGKYGLLFRDLIYTRQ